MKDKIYYNKINEIREERMQAQFYTGSAKSVPTSSAQATHLRFSTPFVKIRLQSLNHTRTTHPLCLDALQQETHILLTNLIE